ncbi:PilZ domain-containing protein [Croceicoccus gelatinilyticus]|uniref:PilZ domain-containing protein n=1 Tax=Croceicoccus gelatinilyticus TaxID=2835536 RepID=UPI001BCF9E12|nr:PilZ domain-containing protein [Croceicoccus gelatinilyticus]
MNDLSPSQFDGHRGDGDTSVRDPQRIPIIRTAKLVFPDAEYPCVLRDISGSALRVKLYGAPIEEGAAGFHLEFGDGDRFEVSAIWVKDDQAGLAFAKHNDLMSLIGEHGPFRKRAIRIAVELPSSVKSLGRRLDVHIRDLSHEGAQILSEAMFSMDQQVRIDIPRLGEVYAKVRWRQHPSYGLAFVETFRFDQIAAVASDLQALSREWRKDGGSGPRPDDMAA